MKDALSKNLFKWKTLSNDPSTGKRAQIMQANRTDNCPQFVNKRGIETEKQPITAKMGCIISLERKEVLISEGKRGIEVLGSTFACMKQLKKELPGQNLIELNQDAAPFKR